MLNYSAESAVKPLNVGEFLSGGQTRVVTCSGTKESPHPRVRLAAREGEDVTCPYCSAVYKD